MPFPASMTLVTVACQFDLLPSGGAAGTVRFSNERALLGAADDSIIPYVDTVATLDASGAASVTLPATNDPQWAPLNFAYDVVAQIGARTVRGTLQLDYQNTSVALADLLQVDGTAQAGVSYLLASQRSVASGVAGLDADGDVIDASGAKVTSGATPGAGDVILDAAGHQVLAATDVQTGFDQVDAALLNARSTGIRTGGALTDLGGGVVRIAAGAGAILDVATPTYTQVSWTQADLDLSAADDVYYVYVTTAGAVTSTTTEPSHSDYRDAIWLHRVSIRGGVLSGSTSIPMPIQQLAAQVWDVWRALGSIKSGLALSAASTDLTVAIGAGEAYAAGSNFHTDPDSPHEVEFALKSPVTFRHVDRDGDQTADRTALDVGNYDSAGTITPIPGSSARATIFTVRMFPGSGGNVRIFYGQAFYTSVSDALIALRDGTYAPTFPAPYDDALTLGWIVAQKGATNLADGVQVLVTANKFGLQGGALATAGAGALLAANNLSDLTDASIARTSLELGDSATLNTGTAAGTVATGDHTHGGGGGGVSVVHAVETGGSMVPQATTPWAKVTGSAEISIAAAVGDYVELSILSMLHDPDSGVFIDLAVEASGALVRYGSNNTGVPAVEGMSGMYRDLPGFMRHGLGMGFVVASGDLDAGTVTFVWATSGTGGGTIYAQAAYPLVWRVINYGAPA